AMGELVGLGILLLVGLVLAVALLSLVVVHDAIRPPRHTAGYAVARGLAVDPGELGLEFQEWSLDLPDGSQMPVWEVTGASEAGREPVARMACSNPRSVVSPSGAVTRAARTIC
ncbi:MAG: hypothetical protein IH804_04445, partial [Planctomycetes bacterium]|nr:hypothetical protein [Planctomycetota bacterium]